VMFKEVVERFLKGDFAYKSRQPQSITISKVIAEREGKQCVPPVIEILPKSFINAFVISEDAKTDALKKWPNSVMAPIEKPYAVKNPYALFLANWYIYLEEEVNVGYIYAAITFGNVPVLPSFFREEFGECCVYYNAELLYPNYRFSLVDFYKTIRNVFKNERLYFSKINCLLDLVSG